MWRSRVPNLEQVGQRLGTRKPAWLLRFPNLPNLPNLCVRVRVRECAGAGGCAHTRAQVTTFMFGRLGRLGRARLDKALRLPNLFPTLGKVGKGCADFWGKDGI
jgi:hypothetical protein